MDHRLVREHHIELLSHEAATLYLFLVTVAYNQGLSYRIKSLAKQLGINLTKRKALQAIPAIGALVGASVNGWYIKEVGWAARRAFQERWLLENHKIIEI